MRKAPIFPVLAILVAGVILVIYWLYAQPLAEDQRFAPNDVRTVSVLQQPAVDFANPALGPVDAPVTIVEYGDYLCAPCAELHGSLRTLLGEFPGKIRLVWKDLPNESSHPGATTAAIAGRCAGEQGAFWEYHAILLAGQAGVNQEAYTAAAATLGLDSDSFSNCVAAQSTAPLVDRDREEGIRLLIDATPYLFINERRNSGALNLDLLRSIVQSELDRIDREAPTSNGN
jgi:protein-disulfide isomerase